MPNDSEGHIGGLPLQTLDLQETAWQAWLEKGRKQDRMRRQRLKATALVTVILLSCAVIWIYLPR
jgi:hypothetical protein